MIPDTSNGRRPSTAQKEAIISELKASNENLATCVETFFGVRIHGHWPLELTLTNITDANMALTEGLRWRGVVYVATMVTPTTTNLAPPERAIKVENTEENLPSDQITSQATQAPRPPASRPREVPQASRATQRPSAPNTTSNAGEMDNATLLRELNTMRAHILRMTTLFENLQDPESRKRVRDELQAITQSLETGHRAAKRSRIA